MKSVRVSVVGLFAIFAAGVGAQVPTSTEKPNLVFRTIPIEGATSSMHMVTPYRLFDKLIVTVSDPVACGQHPLDPAVAIEGGRILLSYKLTPAGAVARQCTLVSEFDVSNVPRRDFEVGFSGGGESYTVTQMRKCPFYGPSTENIWECLMPSAK